MDGSGQLRRVGAPQSRGPARASQDYEALKRLADAQGIDLSDYCVKILTGHIRASNKQEE